MPVETEIKQISIDSGLQASRFKPAPPELVELIALVNVVPPNFDLPDLSYLMDGDPSLIGSNILLALSELGKHLPSLFDIYLMLGKERVLEILIPKPREIEDESEDEDDAYSRSIRGEDENDSRPNLSYLAFYRYQEFRNYREKLRCIARIASSWKPEQSAFFEYLIDAKDHKVLNISSQLSLDKNGHIYIKKNFFEAAVSGVDATRIRECEVCKRIFWAGRITMKGCSARCGDVLRKRRYRERQNEYEYRRYRKEETAKKQTLKTPIRKKGK